MARILANCPVNGATLDTNIETDSASFALLPDFLGRVFCPHCRLEHEWGKVGARIEAEPT